MVVWTHLVVKKEKTKKACGDVSDPKYDTCRK